MRLPFEMHRPILLLLLLLTAIHTSAQFNIGYELQNNVVTVHGSDTLKMPWAGGLNNPQFTSFDMNFDATEDLLVHELDGKILKCFNYSDVTGEYSWDPDCARGFPKLNAHYVIMRDYDADGKKDIFTTSTTQGWLQVYRNVSTDSNFVFEAKTSGLGVSYKDGNTPLRPALLQGNMPSIIDADNDGDLDFFMLKVDPISSVPGAPPTIILLQNLSMETYNIPDSLVFREENACWGKFAEFLDASGYEVFDCTTGVASAVSRHAGASTCNILDLDGDGLLDVLLSDQYTRNLVAGYNINDNMDGEVEISSMDQNFPSYDESADIPSLVASYYVDVDHDGNRDLMCAPNDVNELTDTSTNRLVDWYYLNTGTDASPVFELQKKGFFASQMIDVGRKARPALGDVNGDGLPDMIIGNEGYGNSEDKYAKLELYLNVGSPGNPIYELEDNDLGQVQQFQWFATHPALGDLNGDGLDDLIVGDDQGMLHFFQNTGTGGNYAFQLTTPQYEGIDVGLNAHPSFFDFNVDGALDMMIGNAQGQIHYFENSGTTTVPDFPSNPTIDELGDINLFLEYDGDATPYFTRAIDSTFGMYAFVSTRKGTILFYGPITDIGATYIPVDSIVVDANETSIAGMDLRGDFKPELVLGQRTGGLYFMSREQDITPGTGERIVSNQTLKLYPNPANQEVTVELDAGPERITNIEVIDITGRPMLVERLSPAKINTSSWPSGIYFVKATLSNGQQVIANLARQ